VDSDRNPEEFATSGSTRGKVAKPPHAVQAQVAVPQPASEAASGAGPNAGYPAWASAVRTGQPAEIASLPPSTLLEIQRVAGNQAVGRLLSPTTSPRPAVQRDGRRRSPDPALERARRLAKLLAKRPPDPAAVTELEGLSEPDLSALDTAATSLSGADATLIRRGVSFVRFWKANKLAEKKGATHADPGKAAEKAGAKVGGGTVEVLTAAKGYSLNYTTTDRNATVADAQWLQFARRQVVAEGPTKGGRPEWADPLDIRLGRPFSDSLLFYWLTTDAADPQWNTDTSDKTSPFFEEGTGTVERSKAMLRMFDAPSPDDTSVRQAFAKAKDRSPERVVSHFHATTYLVKGMNVIYRANIHLSWPFKKADVVPTMEATATGGPVTEVAPEHRARLLKQFPDLDYLPGKPLPKPRRRRLPFLDVKFDKDGWKAQEDAWTAQKDLKERYADVARMAQADRIESVWALSATAINDLTEVADEKAGKAGLNFASKLPEDGTTRFVDAGGNLQGKLPVTQSGRLPRVAVILGPKALERDKVFALGTLRHEMEHARHHELAIEWLLKWRSERPGTPFWTWIGSQNLPKNITGLIDFAKPGGSRVPSELVAHVEGFVSTFRFVPPEPAISLMKSGNYPAAIGALKELGLKAFVKLGKDARGDALDLVRDFCCRDQTTGKALLKWLDALIDPTLFKPQAADDQTITLIKNDFGSGATSTAGQKDLKGFLQELRTVIQKPCPK
jgi:hypothetical protein